MERLREASEEGRHRLQRAHRERLAGMDARIRAVRDKERRLAQLERLQAASSEKCARLQADIQAIKAQKACRSAPPSLRPCRLAGAADAHVHSSRAAGHRRPVGCDTRGSQRQGIRPEAHAEGWRLWGMCGHRCGWRARWSRARRTLRRGAGRASARWPRCARRAGGRAARVQKLEALQAKQAAVLRRKTEEAEAARRPPQGTGAVWSRPQCPCLPGMHASP